MPDDNMNNNLTYVKEYIINEANQTLQQEHLQPQILFQTVSDATAPNFNCLLFV